MRTLNACGTSAILSGYGRNNITFVHRIIMAYFYYTSLSALSSYIMNKLN